MVQERVSHHRSGSVGATDLGEPRSLEHGQRSGEDGGWRRRCRRGRRASRSGLRRPALHVEGRCDYRTPRVEEIVGTSMSWGLSLGIRRHAQVVATSQRSLARCAQRRPGWILPRRRRPCLSSALRFSPMTVDLDEHDRTEPPLDGTEWETFDQHESRRADEAPRLRRGRLVRAMAPRRATP